MSYKSPLHILQSLEIAPEELSPEGILRLRKKMLADFNLQPGMTIAVGNAAYTKDEILKTIDALRESDQLSVHLEIYKRPYLLKWLEAPEKHTCPAAEIREIFLAEPADGQMQAMVLEAIEATTKHLLKMADFKQLNPLLEGIQKIDAASLNEVYELIYNELSYTIELLGEAVQHPNVAQDRKTFYFLQSYDWTDFLNLLPDDFEGLRNNFCTNAINYTVAIQKLDRKWVYSISLQLIKTKCDRELKTIIDGNHQVYRDNQSSSGEGGDSEISAWTVIKVIAFILIAFARIASCSH